MDAGGVTIARWDAGDLPLLVAANTPAMTEHLGGPETDEQLRNRHERYLADTGDSRMYRIEVDGVGAGGIGFWRVEHDDSPAWETGWNVLPGFQGRGAAGAALRMLLRELPDDGLPLVAYPGVDNEPSNALCRRAGFERVREVTEPWRGGELTSNVWVLDRSPLRPSGRDVTPSEWWPYYTPHWSSRDAAAARAVFTSSNSVHLRIEEDTAPWAPAIDGDIRVSHLQTGQFSGPLGSSIGQHRFREGLVVVEEQPERRLLLAHHGVISVRMAAIRHPDVMVAFWPIGFEDQPDDCGEICIAEIFGSEVDDGLVGIGVKAQNDPRLVTDFEKIPVPGDLTEMHHYAVEWTRERLRFFVDGRWVKTVAQTIDYPVQLMLDVYEFPRSPRDIAALPHVLHVERVQVPLAVRLATRDDADLVARLLDDFNREFDTETPGVYVLAERLHRLLDEPSTFAVIGGAQGVALVTLRPNVWYPGPVALLDEMYVAPSARGGGIGGAILERVLNECRARGVSSIEINVDEGDVDAQRFYERHGFRGASDDGERAFFYEQEL